MPELSDKLAAKLAELPSRPGVYQMKSARGKILYIGKAKSLKDRVSSYFVDSARHDPRISHLVTQIRDLDWVIVPSEVDALMLESSLVRQFKPTYNTMLKDDKSYPYVKISTNEPYPRVMLTRRYLDDKAKYWGPMTNVTQVRRAVRFIANLFQIRTCKLEIDGEKFYQKPCLDFHLKLCSAPCVNYISRQDYNRLVGFAVDFFNGNYKRVLAELKTKMQDAAADKQYENAARYRDLIQSIEANFERTRVIGKPGENLDIIGLARSKDSACVMIMPVRDGRLLGEQKYVLNHRMEDSEDDDVLAGFLKLHYGNPLNIPPELVLPREPQEAEVLREWMGRLRWKAKRDLEEYTEVSTAKRKPKSGGRASSDSGGRASVPASVESRAETPALPDIDGGHGGPPHKSGEGKQEEDGSGGVPAADSTATDSTAADGDAAYITDETKSLKMTFTIPQRGHKKELLEIAVRNALERLHTVLLGKSEDYVVTPGMKALAEQLDLPDYPRRIEGYDIANLHGKQATGAMVVFTGGRKASAEYRLFNIRLKDTPDDFAMLRETLTRRLTRLVTDEKWAREVDLIMIDGGKGQLSSAQQVLKTMLASPEYSQEQKEQLERIRLISLAKQEELVYSYGADGKPVELRLPHDDPGLRLLVMLRNEAHRYSNSQHVKLREKAMKLSVLDTIPGLGDSRKHALLQHFGSAKRIREASVDELSEVKGIGTRYAEQIRRYLDRDAELEESKAQMKREMRVRRIKRHNENLNE